MPHSACVCESEMLARGLTLCSLSERTERRRSSDCAGRPIHQRSACRLPRYTKTKPRSKAVDPKETKLLVVTPFRNCVENFDKVTAKAAQEKVEYAEEIKALTERLSQQEQAAEITIERMSGTSRAQT